MKKKRGTSGESQELAAGGARGRRLVAAGALVALVPALAILVWSRPAAVGPYLGLAAARSEAVALTLGPRGFEPARVERGAGAFTLSISNQAGAGEVRLRLHRSSGERIQEMTVAEGASGWSGEVSLPAGTYMIVAPDNPAWSCGLKIQ